MSVKFYRSSTCVKVSCLTCDLTLWVSCNVMPIWDPNERTTDIPINRRSDHSEYGLSKWEKALHSSTAFHWPSPYPKWPLRPIEDIWSIHNIVEKLQRHYTRGIGLIFLEYSGTTTHSLNPLRAIFLRENINIYLHMSFPHIDMTQLLEILLHVRPGSTYSTHILHSQYRGCWCPGDVRSQDISNHDINLVKPK